jgi:hypothetical protein
MVVEPATALFNYMMCKVKTLPSYTGGTVIVAYLILGAVVFVYVYYDFPLFEPDWFENYWLFLLSQGIRDFLIRITMDFPMHVFLSQI